MVRISVELKEYVWLESVLNRRGRQRLESVLNSRNRCGLNQC